ncbi:unnamed protein product [Caenorhabditis auriculariae]|uniref:Uncharacterized protein n=1 Tax=Caenorhabditis auriculariae TaxID=2777116 RepID=A0A8S1GML2_9PELO|nr:unnamed protein product [Caenorhabditis auriculariae]
MNRRAVMSSQQETRRNNQKRSSRLIGLDCCCLHSNCNNKSYDQRVAQQAEVVASDLHRAGEYTDVVAIGMGSRKKKNLLTEVSHNEKPLHYVGSIQRYRGNAKMNFAGSDAAGRHILGNSGSVKHMLFAPSSPGRVARGQILLYTTLESEARPGNVVRTEDRKTEKSLTLWPEQSSSLPRIVFGINERSEYQLSPGITELTPVDTLRDNYLPTAKCFRSSFIRVYMCFKAFSTQSFCHSIFSFSQVEKMASMDAKMKCPLGDIRLRMDSVFKHDDNSSRSVIDIFIRSTTISHVFFASHIILPTSDW